MLYITYKTCCTKRQKKARQTNYRQTPSYYIYVKRLQIVVKLYYSTIARQILLQNDALRHFYTHGEMQAPYNAVLKV